MATTNYPPEITEARRLYDEMGKVLKLLVSPALIPLVYAFVYEAFLFAIYYVDFQPVQWFLYGILSYVLIYPIIRDSNNTTFVEHFEHELGHAVLNLAWFRSFDEFRVNPKEDESKVTTRGLFNIGFLTSLAPYYLPVFTIPLLIIKPLLFASIRHVIDFLIGFTLAFHYVALLREFHRDQPDIKKHTRVFSFLITCFMNAVVLVIILCAVVEDYLLLLNYLDSSITRAIESYQVISQEFQKQLLKYW